MGLFSSLFGTSKPHQPKSPIWIPGQGSFSQEIVGEASINKHLNQSVVVELPMVSTTGQTLV